MYTEEIKQRRLTEIIKVQHENQLAYFEKQIGKEFEVLIEKVSKKSDEEYMGRNEHSSSIIFPKGNHKVGEYVNVKITSCTKASMRGELI